MTGPPPVGLALVRGGCGPGSAVSGHVALGSHDDRLHGVGAGLSRGVHRRGSARFGRGDVVRAPGHDDEGQDAHGGEHEPARTVCSHAVKANAGQAPIRMS